MAAVYVLYMHAVHTQTLTVRVCHSWTLTLEMFWWNQTVTYYFARFLTSHHPALLDHQWERGQPHEERARPRVLSSSGGEGPQQEGEEFRGRKSPSTKKCVTYFTWMCDLHCAEWFWLFFKRDFYVWCFFFIQSGSYWLRAQSENMMSQTSVHQSGFSNMWIWIQLVVWKLSCWNHILCTTYPICVLSWSILLCE